MGFAAIDNPVRLETRYCALLRERFPLLGVTPPRFRTRERVAVIAPMRYIAFMSTVRQAPLDRRSAADQIYERLRADIENGVLEPGETIMDGALAEQLGVSRTPVREALRRLVDQGAVWTAPGRHTRVAEAEEAELDQVFPLLSVLHEFAARSAAEHVDENDLARMAECNEGMLRSARNGDIGTARDYDREFHDVLVRRAGNPYLSSVIDLVALHSRRFEALYFRDREPVEESYEQHTGIIEALRAGDHARAAQLTRNNAARGPRT